MYKQNILLSLIFVLCVNFLNGEILTPRKKDKALKQPTQTIKHQDPLNKSSSKCINPQYPKHKKFGKDFVSPLPLEKIQIDSQSWKQQHNSDCVFTNDNIQDQFQSDIGIWLNTLFNRTNTVGGKKLSNKEQYILIKKQEFLRRWFLLMAYAPIHYVRSDNASSENSNSLSFQRPVHFPFPLASSISHGQRILMTLTNKSGTSKLNKLMYNLLLSGAVDQKPVIDEFRSFASHGVSKAPNNKLIEEKLLTGFLGAIRGNHHMINIPVGGVGNKNELNYFIGPEGESYTKDDDKRVDNFQLGHVFIAEHSFSDNISSLLMGVESTAPYKTSPFSEGEKTHTIISGYEDESKTRAVLGGQKWSKLLGDLAPAKYGGMLINIEDSQLEELKALFDIILSWDEKKQFVFFLKLISMNASEANNFLFTHKELSSIFL
ncbi:MAG: hypothetical protein COY39_00350 [Alphaproteobacteria bacterium CG_4_10_14_0_8_um_filter_37_21]|nr:MAG: hypothetical protein COY39_00350 [Alphaproteobacteria bacterium CG_4_10_14_0_8_um_filter_37_21]